MSFATASRFAARRISNDTGVSGSFLTARNNCGSSAVTRHVPETSKNGKRTLGSGGAVRRPGRDAGYGTRIIKVSGVRVWESYNNSVCTSPPKTTKESERVILL